MFWEILLILTFRWSLNGLKFSVIKVDFFGFYLKIFKLKGVFLLSVLLTRMFLVVCEIENNEMICLCLFAFLALSPTISRGRSS